MKHINILIASIFFISLSSCEKEKKAVKIEQISSIIYYHYDIERENPSPPIIYVNFRFINSTKNKFLLITKNGEDGEGINNIKGSFILHYKKNGREIDYYLYGGPTLEINPFDTSYLKCTIPSENIIDSTTNLCNSKSENYYKTKMIDILNNSSISLYPVASDKLKYDVYFNKMKEYLSLDTCVINKSLNYKVIYESPPASDVAPLTK